MHLRDHDVVGVVTRNVEDLDFDPDKDQALCAPISADTTEAPSPLDVIKAKKKQPRPLPHPGIDTECLQSESGLTDLHLNLKFKKLLGSSAAVRKLQCW